MNVVNRTASDRIELCAVIDGAHAEPFQRSRTPWARNCFDPATQSSPWYDTAAAGNCSDGGGGRAVHRVPFHVQTTPVVAPLVLVPATTSWPFHTVSALGLNGIP